MSFQIIPQQEFLVRPGLPPQIERLSELAFNLLWSWDYVVRSLFWRLDQNLWEATNHNPVLMLGRVPQETLERAASDPRYLAFYKRACERYDDYMSEQPRPDRLVAYFSMEYGLLDCMPIYSGGLGVLSGDHLKSASDARIPLVAVGLLYQRGYLQQSLNPDGWQQERNPVNDFYSLPVAPVYDQDGKEVIVHVSLPTGAVAIKVWHINVGRVQLYLLDTNIPENENPLHRDITDHLYGGDAYTRMRQEIVLGIGGLRALKQLGIQPAVYHMNEGHSAFLAIERIRLLMADHGLSMEEALTASRTNNIFTTHTSVPAGIDVFDLSLMQEFFADYCRDAGISLEEFLLLGHNGRDGHFSMAVLALKTSALRNAVSRLHRAVSQELWQNLWPRLPVWEVPITSVTNGVHLPTWISADLAKLYDRYLQPDWREEHAAPGVWDALEEIPNQELWEVKRTRKRRLVNFVRHHAVANATRRNAPASEIRRLNEIFDPEALTIGFARRFATYKRATLLFRDLDRLRRILKNPGRPVQIIIAGKAHPKDLPGKTLIQQIVQYSRDPELANHVIFLEDYGIHVAREMVQACDLWLNTPRRLEEACGTSGMKAGLNGGLNLSVLDGWFDEAASNVGGWAIGDREGYGSDQDEVHALSLYSLLENEVVPLYYEERDKGVPHGWIRRVKTSLKEVSSQFNCQRMVEEYRRELYDPALAGFQQISSDDFKEARNRAHWDREVTQRWPNVSFLQVGPSPEREMKSGSTIPLRAVVDLAGLTPQDVRVEAVVGRVGVNGNLEETQVLTLDAAEQHGSVYVFGREFPLSNTGLLGYSVRISPNHYDDPLTRPCHSLLKWGWDRTE